MTNKQNPEPKRGSGALPRARGTGPLDAFEVMAKAPPLPDDGQVVHRDALATAIAEAESLLTMLRPRFGSLGRALDARDMTGASLEALFKGVSTGERTFTMQLSRLFGSNPDVERKARIARQQYQHAEKELANAKEVLARFDARQIDERVVPGFSLSKFRGMLYPLHNVASTFAGIQMLDRLFPTTQNKAKTQPLPADEVMEARESASRADDGPPTTLVERASTWLRGIYDVIKPQ